MSNPDPVNVLFSSRYAYFLNRELVTDSLSIPAVSIPAGEARSYSLSIPIDSANDYSQIKIEFSHDAGDWYVFPTSGDITLDANFTIAVVGSYGASALTLTFYVVNQTGGAATNTATTASVRVRLFEPPA